MPALSVIADLEIRAAQYEANGAWEDYVSMERPTVPRRFLNHYQDAAFNVFRSLMDARAIETEYVRWEWHGNNVWSFTYNDTRCYATWNERGTWTYAILDISCTRVSVYETGEMGGAGLWGTLPYGPLDRMSHKTCDIDDANAPEGDDWADAWGTSNEWD